MNKGMEHKILEKLTILEEKGVQLPIFPEFYRKILSIQSDVKKKSVLSACDLGPEAINKRLSAGRPVLDFDNLSGNLSQIREAFERVSALLSEYPETRAMITGNPGLSASFTRETAKSWFEGAPPPSTGEDSDTGKELREFLMHAAFHPVLVSYQEEISGHLNQELWRRGYCPVCGGRPDFSYLDRERGARWLLCSRCDAEWLFKRLECPGCGSQDQNTLAYFTDDKGLYRLYVCDRCHGYLKAIDLRQAEDEVLLPLERFLSFHLDIQARDSGYKPAAGAGTAAGSGGRR